MMVMSTPPPQSPTERTAPSQFSLSFERVTVESLILPWNDVEHIHEQMREKRRQVHLHTQQAAEHLRAITLLQAELDSLEASFSATMAAVVAERSRSQERLRALVLEWERSQVQQAAERAVEVQQRHTTEMEQLKKKLAKVTSELESKQQRLDSVTARNQEMQALMQEYGLETSGPLVEALQAKRLLSPSEKKDGRRPSLFLDQVSPQTTSSAAYAKLSKETDHLRAEVLRLQADLSAAKAESKVRRTEIDALRSTREEWSTLSTTPPPAEDHAFYRLQAGRGSASSVASGAPPYNAATSSSRYTTTTQQTTTQHHQQHQHYTSSWNGGTEDPATPPPPPQPHPGVSTPPPSISIGLDLGTRRQQQGLSGVHIVGVLEGSPSWLAGIRPNDVLVGWGGHTIHQLEDVGIASRSLPHGLVSLEVVFVRGVGFQEELQSGGSHHRSFVVSIPLEGKLSGPYNSRREAFLAH